jgi:ABC-type multidrug transport system fused ATPase/permease subunit
LFAALPSRARMSVLLIFTLLILPSAQPFASGASGGGSAGSLSTTTPLRTDADVWARQATAGDASLADHHNNPRRPKSRLVGNLWKGLRESTQRRTSTGEYSVALPKRLIFSYAGPLLKKASAEGLSMEDALQVPESRRMEQSVRHLSDTYLDLRDESRQTLEEAKLEGKETSAEAFLLTKALFLHQRPMLIYTGMLRLVNTFIQAFPALLVARLLRLVEAGEAQPVRKALTTAVTLVALLSVKMVTENQYFHNVVKYSTQVRGGLAGLLFEKALRLPGGGSGITHQERRKGAIGVGGVLNLMQSDASIVESAAVQIHTTWDGILQLAMYTYLLYRFLGNSVFYGIGVLVATIPVNSIALRILNRLAKFENEAKDARNKRTAESLANMKLLKLFGWEDRFAEDIRGHRAEELDRHVQRGAVRATNSAVSNAVPALVLVVTLTAYARAGKPMVASTIFTAISLFNQLRFPLFFYPMLVDSLANARNAMLRIAHFLSAEEMSRYVEQRPATAAGGRIEMTNGNFLWSVSSGTEEETDSTEAVVPALSNVNLKVGPGEVVAVVGSVGSGKSALIKGLLGELSPVPGTIMQQTLSIPEDKMEAPHGALVKPSVVTEGNFAYCSQEAWLPKGSIRDAIVFGREFDQDRYLSAIRDAGLDKDIVESSARADPKKGQLTHDTDVGEHGSGLSGGQRARVSLARALYAGNDTQVFLLDDVLAALDANVGSIVFERLTKRLRAQKAAVILVTNDPSIPRRCDRVVLMGKTSTPVPCSTVLDQGTYDELIGRGRKLQSVSPTITDANGDLIESKYGDDISYKVASNMDSERSGSKPVRVVGGYTGPVNATVYDADKFGHADPEEAASMEKCPDYCNSDTVVTHQEHLLNLGTTEVIDVYNGTEVSTTEPIAKEPPQSVMNTDEESKPAQKTLTSMDDTMSTGAIPLSTYFSYIKSVRSPLLIAMMLGSFMTVNGAQFFQQLTVARWSEAATNGLSAALGAQYLRSLLNAAIVVSVFLFLRTYLLMRVGLRASHFLHSRMLQSVFKAPLSFFSSTSSGTLMSRFGKELETVDRGVPDSIGSVLFCFLQIFTSIGALAGIVTPAMAFPLVAVGFLYVRTMSLFRPAARDMKRAETKTRSPIYTHFGEALRGSETIRSIPGASRYWSSEHRSLTDRNLGVFYTVKAFDRWLSIRLETLGNTIVFTSAIAAVYLTRAGTLTAGSAGWGLTQSLSITGLLTWAVRCLTDLESSMMSVMRVRELTDLDREDVDLDKLSSAHVPSSKARIPKEYANGGDALQPLLPPGSVSTSLAPQNSHALVESGWPWRGNIVFKNVSMRYNPFSPLVLRDVTLSIPAGTTLGIVGRTGSGKSSLLLTLFRIVELEAGGSIEIDGVDIRSLDMKSLRQSLAIIPQEPTLFQGDIAYNLDATGASSEADMWAALETAAPNMAVQFRQGDGLKTAVSEGGNNLSVGQRQLICLARALLRKSRVLVLDEATSSVDSKTDQEIQDTIRREFVNKGVTVMTVAHRLDTVLGYDKIAVLGAGRVLEYGSASELLRIPGGELRQLVDADLRNKAKGSAKAAALAASSQTPLSASTEPATPRVSV